MILLTEKAKKIINSYKNLPSEPILELSMVNELSNLIVDYVCFRKEDIKDFDFDEFFKELKLK